MKTNTHQLLSALLTLTFSLAGMVALAAPPKPAPLPLVIYSEAGRPEPFTPSGYMGNTGAVRMDGASTAGPHSGKTCLQVTYSAKDQWGGVVWQNPANNWGDKAGGLNLSGAKKLTFWAKGAKGGEVVSFAYGLIGANKPIHDSGKGKLDKVTLTKAWKQYSVPVAGQNLSHIVTGFSWSLAAAGAPVTFYLDDIAFTR